MLIKTQKSNNETYFVNPEKVCAWEIRESTVNGNPLVVLWAFTGNDPCDPVWMGIFKSVQKAEDWLCKMQIGMTAGRQFMAVPSLTEQNIEKESAQWD